MYLCIICLSINKKNKYKKLDFTAFAQTKLLIRQAEILHWYFKLESNLIIFWKEISFPKCLFFSLQCIKLMTYNFSFFCILCWESNFLCKNILMQWNIYVKIFMSLYDITFTNRFSDQLITIIFFPKLKHKERWFRHTWSFCCFLKFNVLMTVTVKWYPLSQSKKFHF